MKSFMPLCIDVSQGRIVVIGGGIVALQKLRTIITYARNVFVYAKDILPDIISLPVTCTKAMYDSNQISEALLVYACTDDRGLNRRISEDGRRIGTLVNTADDQDNCDIISPAIFRHEEMSVAVSSNGHCPKRSVNWRNAIREFALNDLVRR
jgi:precorrin-2 dehydrogenase/sirohydrochlorin ferrochelatase